MNECRQWTKSILRRQTINEHGTHNCTCACRDDSERNKKILKLFTKCYISPRLGYEKIDNSFLGTFFES